MRACAAADRARPLPSQLERALRSVVIFKGFLHQSEDEGLGLLKSDWCVGGAGAAPAMSSIAAL
jgi:hypothetical protein